MSFSFDPSEGPRVLLDVLTGEVSRDGTPLHVSAGTLELVTLLAVMRRPVRREVVMDCLWPDLDGDSADNALGVCVHRARRQLEDPGAIVSANRMIGLGASIRSNYAEILELVGNHGPVSHACREKLTKVFESLAHWLAAGCANWVWFVPYRTRLLHAAQAIGRRLADDARMNGHHHKVTYLNDLLREIGDVTIL